MAHNERNAGRKLKYGEKKVRVVRYYPPIAIPEIDEKANEILETYKKK